jgi:putative nucleotidyltransferase with HDIG domain
MQASARHALRTPKPSGIPRLRQRVFGRFIVVFGGVVTLTVALMALIYGLSHSIVGTCVGGWLAGMGVSVLAAKLWSNLFAQRMEELIESIRAGSPAHGQELAAASADRLFSEVILTWQKAVKTLQEGWQAKQEEARRSYETLAELIRMMAKAVDERATYLRGHSERVAVYAAAIARRMGLNEERVEWVRLSGLLHDIGTLGIEDYLVTKDAPLAPEEFEIVKAHTVKGAAILRPIEMLNEVIPGVELHHEALDGSGYPYGLKGDQIPLMARIISVADSFDAMTTPRPYQAAMNPDYVLEVMQRLAGTRYDPDVVAALTALIGNGTLEVKKLRIPVSFRMRRPTIETT